MEPCGEPPPELWFSAPRFSPQLDLCLVVGLEKRFRSGRKCAPKVWSFSGPKINRTRWAPITWGFGVWSPRPSIKLIYKAIRFQAPLGSCSIYIQVHGSSGSPETSFKLIDMQAHEISGSLNNLLHIYIQAHEAARSLGTFFQIYLQAHEISGVRETSFTHHMQAHLFFGVSLILLQIDGQVHMRFQGPLGRPSNLYTGP